MMIKEIAMVTGDGSAPEMMAVACPIALEAAKKDGIEIRFVPTPMGWNAYEEFGDTLPRTSLEEALRIGTVYFGGVGDPKLDNTIGKEKPEMKPEGRTLLALRKLMGLLLNFRPMIYRKELGHSNYITQVWVRFLLEDSYFGNQDLMDLIPEDLRRKIGVMLKKDVTGDEEIVADIAYYRKSTIEKYARAAFKYAKNLGLPVISIDKANVMSRYDFWRKIFTRIGKTEFPDVSLQHQLVDSANALLVTPEKLNGVIVCGNEHGDILSDGAASVIGGMGLMCSSAVNPDTGQAMFESGAGTAPTLAGQDKADPIGRILTAAMMLRHIGAVKSADSIENAVNEVLKIGYRTGDLPGADDPKNTLVGTRKMGELILLAL